MTFLEVAVCINSLLLAGVIGYSAGCFEKKFHENLSKNTNSAADILSGKSEYVNGSKIDGSLDIRHFWRYRK